MVFNVKSFYILSYLLVLIIKYDDLKKDSNLGYLSHLFHIKIPLYRLILFFFKLKFGEISKKKTNIMTSY